MNSNIFFNTKTYAVIELEPQVDALRFAGANPELFGLPSAPMCNYNLDTIKEILKGIAANHWVSISSARTSSRLVVQGISLSEIPFIVQHAIESLDLEVPEKILLWTPEAGYGEMKKPEIVNCLANAAFMDEILRRNIQNNIKLNKLVDILLEAPHAKEMRVFGSIAAGKPFPADLDIFVDLVQIENPLATSNSLLALCHEFYPLMDVFIMEQRGLMVRDDESRVYVKCKNIKYMIKSIMSNFTFLTDIKKLPENVNDYLKNTENSSVNFETNVEKRCNF